MISKIHKLLNKYLPEKYHYEIRIFPSIKKMLEEMKRRDGVKETLGQIEKHIDTDIEILSANVGKYTASFNEKYPSKVKNRKGVVYAFSGEPILLNGSVLYREYPQFVAAVILHEIGHNEGYITEDGADKFAIKWMDRVWDNIEKEL